MKRLTIFLLILCVTGSLLWAGGAKENGSSQDMDTFTMAPYQAAPVDEDGKLLKLWEEKFDVNFDIWNVENSQYQEVMNLRLSSGEVPDFMYCSADMMVQWAGQGLLAEIPLDFLKEHAPDAYDMAIELSPDVFKATTINGKVYGLSWIPMPESSVRYGPAVWRGDWLEAVGITKTPETLKEFEEAFYKFAKEDPDGNGVDDTYGLSASGMRDLWGAYGLGQDAWIEKNGKVVYAPIQPEAKEVLKLFNKWYEDGVIDPEYITYDIVTGTGGENTGGAWYISNAFASGRIGFTGHSGYRFWKPAVDEEDAPGAMWNEMYNRNPQAAENLVFGKLATGPTGLSGTYYAGQSNPVIGNPMWAFGKHLENQPERFAKLLSVLNDIKYQNSETKKESFLTSWYGIKGEDWDYDSNGGIKVIGEAANDSTYMTRMGGHHVFSFLGPYTWPGLPNKMLDWAKANNFEQGILKRAVPAGTIVDAQAKYGTELLTMQQEAFNAIITGKQPISYFDEFVEKWYKNGGQKIEEEIRDWHNQFWN